MKFIIKPYGGGNYVSALLDTAFEMDKEYPTKHRLTAIDQLLNAGLNVQVKLVDFAGIDGHIDTLIYIDRGPYSFKQR